MLHQGNANYISITLKNQINKKSSKNIYIWQSLFLLIVEQLQSQKGHKFNIYSALLNGLRRLLLGDLINEIICLFSRFGSPRTVTETKRIFISFWDFGLVFIFIFTLAALQFVWLFHRELEHISISPVRIAFVIVCSHELMLLQERIPVY